MLDIVSLAIPETALRYKAPHDAPREPLYISEYGRTFAGTPCYQIRLASGVSSLQYVVSGSGVIICNERLYTVKTGDAFLLPEGSDQIYYSNEDNVFERIWINYTGTLGHSLAAAYGIDQAVVFRGAHVEREMTALLDACLSAKEGAAYGRASALAYHAVLARLSEVGGGDDAESPMERVRYYIDTHITEDLKLSDVARALGYSPEHVCRRFGRTYGITPHSYILQSRLRMAMVMLSTSDRSVAQIAETLRFSDACHFSAQFLSHVGMRPSAYRRAYNTERHG